MGIASLPWDCQQNRKLWALVELRIIGGISGLSARFSGLNVWISEDWRDFGVDISESSPGFLRSRGVLRCKKYDEMKLRDESCCED